MPDVDIVIVGAGAAGLACARRLAIAGLQTVVLEARDRVGGRVVEASKGAVSAELGGEFIHGPAHETRALLREIGQREVEPDGDDWVRSSKGALQRREDEFRSAVSLFKNVDKLEADESVERFLARYANGRADAQRVEDARAFVEGFDAADPAKASARGIAFEWESGVDSQAARPVGGYRPMFDYLYEDCAKAGVRFEFSTIVERIEWQPGSVTVSARDGSQAVRAFRARAAIVTLPIGVLRNGDVRFEPELPSLKREALEKILMGDVVKVALFFRSPFWEDVAGGRYRGAAFFRDSSAVFQAYWTQLPLRQPLVIAWVGGPAATELRRRPGDEIVAQALDGFGTLLDAKDRAHEEFEGGIMHDWGGDPFARGAYSYLAVGGGNARSQLASALDGTLFFAGEATSEDGQGGTVNGALATGERAAREVAARFATDRRS
ncbi:MAG: FAD-dependent oxidoreductase [Candidatus Eremiobacteraeota bacterium]|nr:FAD-dependent oxidoreductase [Candidatus Eremiobacteraeota bacterium]